MKKITTVDLFCGAGGFTEGFQKAGGFETLLAIDFDEQAVKTFNHNHPCIDAICADICNVDESDLNTLLRGKAVDVVIGGPPCQGFSLAGPRMPDDPKNQLFKEFVRVVHALKPHYFVFENVAGLVSMQGGLVLEAICEEFSRIGYEATHSVISAADFGVPQARPRFILIGSRDNKRVEMPPKTHDNPANCNMDLFGAPLKSHVTVADALSSLPPLDHSEGAEEMESPSPINEFQETIRGHRNPSMLFNHRATRHSDKIVERYNALPQGCNGSALPLELQTKKQNVYRLLESVPSRTVTCNFRTDIIHPWKPRGLTTREAARLQSFDDDYQFFGNLTRKAKFVTQDDQVGNAVPPLLAQAIAKHLKGHL